MTRKPKLQNQGVATPREVPALTRRDNIPRLARVIHQETII